MSKERSIDRQIAERIDKKKLMDWLDEKADALYFGAVQAKVVEILREIESGTFDAPEDHFNAAVETCHKLEVRLSELIVENAKLVKALEWYGNPETYGISMLGKINGAPIKEDGGKRARDLLSELRGGETT